MIMTTHANSPVTESWQRPLRCYDSDQSVVLTTVNDHYVAMTTTIMSSCHEYRTQTLQLVLYSWGELDFTHYTFYIQYALCTYNPTHCNLCITQCVLCELFCVNEWKCDPLIVCEWVLCMHEREEGINKCVNVKCEMWNTKCEMLDYKYLHSYFSAKFHILKRFVALFSRLRNVAYRKDQIVNGAWVS